MERRLLPRGRRQGEAPLPGVGDRSTKRTITCGSAVTGVSAAKEWATESCANGEVVADKFPGEITWLYQSTAAISAPVTVQNGVVYVTGQDGTVRAFTVPGTQIP